MFKGAELEQLLADYAQQLGGIEETIADPGNKFKQLRLFKQAGRIFLVVHAGADPLVVDFLLPAEIAATMVEQYDTAAVSNLLDKRRAVRLVLTGEFSEDDLKSFLLQSFQQAPHE